MLKRSDLSGNKRSYFLHCVFKAGVCQFVMDTHNQAMK